MPVQLVNEATFAQEVMQSELPVLVDLMADWCAPCKQLAPILDDIARELDGRLKVVRVDIDRSPAIAQAFQVKSVPMLAVVVGGRVARTVVGLQPKAQLLQLLQEFLPREPGAPESVSPKDLAGLLSTRRAVPVDLRDAAVYGRNHLPNALSLPEADVEKRAQELRRLRGVPVLYCRGGDRSVEVAKMLGAMGIPVGVLTGGILAWEAEGLPVERPS